MSWPDRQVLVEERAAAKVNLWLRVGPRRADGFHAIRSLAVGVTLEDRLQVWYKPSHGRLVFRVVGAGELEANDNLCVRAIRWWTARFGAPPGHLEIVLHKAIPIAAGLGGGSSDAAALLRALGRLSGTDVRSLRPEEVAELGSDVPYCMESVPALMEGRGELLSPRSVSISFLCLAWPRWSWSSRDAYEALDEMRESGEAGPGSGFESAVEPELGWNDFLPMALRRDPELAKLRGKLQATGARVVGMTGKGPVQFGVYETWTQAERAADILERAGLWARAVQVVPGVSSAGLES